ncbi:MAG: S49 family peptidase [Vulcanimicrobiaceae bacterium]
MTQLAHIATRLINTPLLITPEYGSVVTTVLSERINVQPMVSQEVVQSYIRPASGRVMNKRSGIVTMPIVGGMIHRGGELESMSGMQSYTSIHNKLQTLFADDDVRGILLDIDSGGGEAAGLAELVEWLPQAAKQAGKPVWGIANTSAGSAAYWLASSTDRLYAAKNSRVGSVGVYVQHVDQSKAIEKKGLVVSFIYAGDHKLDGNPFGPLPDDVRASIQSGVDKLYGDFVSAVASNREMTEEAVRATQARVYTPDDAYALGLVDGVGGLGSVLAAFTEHLNRPYVGYSSHGVSMTKELIYDQGALDRARAEGVATAKSESAAALTDAASKLTAATAERTELLTAFAALAPENPKVAIFVEALNEGGSVSLASKMAAKIEAPKAAAVPAVAKTQTEAAVDALLSKSAPNVSDNGGDEGGPVDAKAARLAEINGSMKAFNTGRGFGGKR